MAANAEKLLPESWEVRRLDEVSVIIDSLHKTPSYSQTGLPMVRVTDVKGGFLNLSNTLRVTEEVFQEFTRRYAPKRGDIVFSRVGSYGNASCVNTDQPFCLGQNTALISPKVNGRYLHLFLQSADARRQVDQLAVGSTQKTISLKSISALQIPVPPPDELEAIASILGALDDKIELNRRMNATLEAMARALFQSWFVDFDPVRAKLDGRPPTGLDPEIAALFPATFQDSPLGNIPQGWEVCRLDDALILQRGFDLPTAVRTHGEYPVMAASGPNGCHDKFMVHGPGVTTGRSGVLGKVFFIHGDFWPLNTSLWVKEFKRVSPAYAFHLLRGLDFEVFNSGSAVPTLNRNHVHDLKVIIPPKEIIDAFDAQVLSLMLKQKANEDQSRTLSNPS